MSLFEILDILWLKYPDERRIELISAADTPGVIGVRLIHQDSDQDTDWYSDMSEFLMSLDLN
jgi:hypothetical protein